MTFKPPVQIDYELTGLRCPVDRCQGELSVISFSATTAPAWTRSSHHINQMEGWVELEYACRECGASGTIKAQMDRTPIAVKTERGLMYRIHLGRPPAGGI